MASNSFMRSAFAAGFPLVRALPSFSPFSFSIYLSDTSSTVSQFANQMYTRLGSVGAGCLLGGLLVLCIPMPFLFFHYGERIRARSKFAHH
jgi:hypothetical protein